MPLILYEFQLSRCESDAPLQRSIPDLDYKKSSPIPTWNPRLDPSLLLATSGTPKLASTLTGSKRYISPTPADIDGFDILSMILSLNDLAVNNING
jgi:hypothetical protein